MNEGLKSIYSVVESQAEVLCMVVGWVTARMVQELMASIRR